ncbi:segregation/condensation protein A [Clostridium cylindrosporum]|uniref:Segregation and condensation protein A n=1 Tax=Clostridium cylindrosporum DSM 605 TaxID=1121307 RepID=A0A0J8D5E5_CLOCY|nr:segregation/condensation protein A [Clostridium cylindrosporum]KMT21370.1 segregation and condensation protein A [Clostridium cylindrosporum DSM 605]
MSINIKIDAFEGPLDLLLHLIKKSEVDIYDIPIARITDQYIAYLKEMEELDLDIASEFLVMAATLVEIKSKMLLPKKKKEDDFDEEDPRLELVEKLIEYKKYKEFAGNLKEIEENTLIYFKGPEIIDDIENKDVFFKNITVENLMIAFRKIMDNYENRHRSEKRVYENISSDEFKIEDKMEFIKYTLENNEKVYFDTFFQFAKNKLEIIVIFMAMLELIKLREIRVYQNNNFDNITIERQV